MSSSQSIVILVEPELFGANPLTKADNAFQADDLHVTKAHHRELRALAKQLQQAGVTVFRVPWTVAEGSKWDSIFPNNSLSLHERPNGIIDIVLYPMSIGRRDEIPPALEQAFKALSPGKFVLHDYRGLVKQQEFASEALESTGVLVFSADGTSVFMARSHRSSERLLIKMLLDGLFPDVRSVHIFDSLDRHGKPVYHTNVIGWIGQRIAGFCIEGLRFGSSPLCPEWQQCQQQRGVTVHDTERDFMAFFEEAGIKLLALTHEEIEHFAGNCLEHSVSDGRRVFTISQNGLNSLTQEHRAAIEAEYGMANIVAANIPTIEHFGGGSIRCTQAAFTVSNITSSLAVELCNALRAVAGPESLAVLTPTTDHDTKVSESTFERCREGSSVSSNEPHQL
jgi:hypothetical protein